MPIDTVSNSTKRFLLAAGKSLVVTPFTTGALAVVALTTPVAGISFGSVAITTSQQIGPFSAPCELIVSAVGSVDVEYGLSAWQVSGASYFLSPRGKKAPVPQIGKPLSVSDFTILAGAPTITAVTGPNGQPAIKVVTALNTAAELSIPVLAGSEFNGDAFIVGHGSYTQGNISFISFYFSQNDASYTNGGVQVCQYSLTTPLQNSLEQGGAQTYFYRKNGFTPFGAPTYPAIVGQIKILITPVAATVGTFYIYGIGTAAPQPKGRICVCWDDGYDSMFKLGYDAMASRGIKQTLGVIGSAQDFGGTYSYTRQLRAFVDAGNACVAHGPWPAQGAGSLFSAYAAGPTFLANAVADMNLNRDWISANGLGVPNFEKCYVWPQGLFQASVNDTSLLDAMLLAGYTTGRGTSNMTGGAIYPQGINFDSLSKYNKLCMPIIGKLWAGTTAAEATDMTATTNAIGFLSTSRTDGILMLHRVLPTATSDGGMGSSGNITIRQGDLETIAAAIKTGVDAGTLETVTMPELAADTWWRQF